jgi:uncharacterized membrane protein YhaH (DUF805 family)
MNFGHILFGFRGRINRAKWWLAVLAIIILDIVMAILNKAVAETLASVLGLVIGIVVLWISLAAGAKRLHDLNRSGAWLVLFIGGPLLLTIIFIIYVVVAVGASILSSPEFDPAILMQVGGTGLIFLVLYLALAIWALVWLGCLRGTVGPNQYGPDPLEGHV